jgi:hypothetical protein
LHLPLLVAAQPQKTDPLPRAISIAIPAGSTTARGSTEIRNLGARPLVFDNLAVIDATPRALPVLDLPMYGIDAVVANYVPGTRCRSERDSSISSRSAARSPACRRPCSAMAGPIWCRNGATIDSSSSATPTVSPTPVRAHRRERRSGVSRSSPTPPR